MSEEDFRTNILVGAKSYYCFMVDSDCLIDVFYLEIGNNCLQISASSTL